MKLIINGVEFSIEQLCQVDLERLAGLLDGLIEDAIDEVEPESATPEQQVRINKLGEASELCLYQLKQLDPNY